MARTPPCVQRDGSIVNPPPLRRFEAKRRSEGVAVEADEKGEVFFFFFLGGEAFVCLFVCLFVLFYLFYFWGGEVFCCVFVGWAGSYLFSRHFSFCLLLMLLTYHKHLPKPPGQQTQQH